MAYSCSGVVGAVCRGSHERAWWLGFTLFGAGDLALAHAMALLTRGRCRRSRWRNSSAPAWTWNSLSATRNRDEGGIRSRRRYRILHCLWAMALALLGGILAGLLVAGPGVVARIRLRRRVHTSASRAFAGSGRPLVGLAGFWIVAMAATVGRWPVPGIWAGVSFLLACGLLGLAALAAAFNRGRDREIWLGAALFGFAYLALTFGKSQLFIVRRTCRPKE